jgi:hypothetical protein
MPAGRVGPEKTGSGMGMTVRTTARRRLGSGRILSVFLFVFFFPSLGSGQTWKWTIETVDTYGVQTSIAIDQDQNLHISYFAGGVKYAFRPADSSHWFTMNIAPPAGYEELFTGLTLDPGGNPHICFTPGVLKYASFENHKWNIQQIDPESGLIDYSCSMAIAADGTQHILWYQYGNPQGGYYLHAKYATLEKGTWLARTLDFDMQAGKWNCLVLDSQGNPHVSYDSFIKGEMKYAYWDGKEWKRTVIDSPNISSKGPYSHGMGNSLVLNRDGRAQISYEDGESVKYAWEKDNSWKIDIVDSITVTGSWIGYRTRQALDPQGNPHIVYEDGGTVKHAYWDGSNWRIQVVSGPGTRKHRYENIAIDRTGNIYISYQDAMDGSVKVAIGRPSVPAQNASIEKKPEK